MDRKNTLFILGIIFAVVFALSLKGPHALRNPYNNDTDLNTCDQAATTTDCNEISSSVSPKTPQPFGPHSVVYENEDSGFSFLQSQRTDNWNIFRNTKYHYLLLYPPIVNIGTNNDYAIKLNEEKSLNFFIPGKTKLIGIDVYTIEPWEEKYYETRTMDSEKNFLKKIKK